MPQVGHYKLTNEVFGDKSRGLTHDIALMFMLFRDRFLSFKRLCRSVVLRWSDEESVFFFFGFGTQCRFDTRTGEKQILRYRSG